VAEESKIRAGCEASPADKCNQPAEKREAEASDDSQDQEPDRTERTPSNGPQNQPLPSIVGDTLVHPGRPILVFGQLDHFFPFLASHGNVPH